MAQNLWRMISWWIRGSDDMYSLCLSMSCVANFAAYERMVLAVSSSKRLGKHLPAEEMTRALAVIWKWSHGQFVVASTRVFL